MPENNVYRFEIVHQFVKELNFANIEGARSKAGKDRPCVSVDLSIQVISHNDNFYEITLKVAFKAFRTTDDAENHREDSLVFIGYVSYSAIVKVIPQDNLSTEDLDDKGQEEHQEIKMALLNVGVPEMLFPYCSHMISFVTQQGGIAPLIINPVDFRKMYDEKKVDEE